MEEEGEEALFVRGELELFLQKHSLAAELRYIVRTCTRCMLVGGSLYVSDGHSHTHTKYDTHRYHGDYLASPDPLSTVHTNLPLHSHDFYPIMCNI